MTETENGSAANGASNGDSVKAAALEAQIIRQVEHYFGDWNLPKDKFLQESISKDEAGWVDMETMLKFKRLSNLSSDAEVILKAVKASTSGLMEVDLEKQKMRRNPEMPLPEYNDERKKELQTMTVYCKGFDKENTKLDELLEHFNKYENVVHVQMRSFVNRKDNSRGFKGSIFVTFKNKESAEKFMKEESVKYKEVELERKWQVDYFADKTKEMEENKKKKKEDKKKNRGEASKDDDKKEGDEKKEEEEDEEKIELPKGAVLHLSGFEGDTMREDIKKVLQDDYEVNCDQDIAFVYYEKGQKEADIRFSAENGAKTVEEKIKAKDEGALKIKDAKIEYNVLEGEAEDAFLEKCVKDIKERKERQKRAKAHKRKGGFGGGRGGKRGRRR